MDNNPCKTNYLILPNEWGECDIFSPRSFETLNSLIKDLNVKPTIFRGHKKASLNELTLFGNIEIRQVDLSFQVTGKIEKMFVEEGDYVKKGQLVAILDDKDYVSNLEKATAEVAKAQALSTDASSKYDRQAPLCSDSTISKQDCETLLNNKNQTKAAYDSTIANKKFANNQLDYTKIYAPDEGVVTVRIQEPGANVQKGQPIYTISKSKPVWIRAYINETDLGNIKYGQFVKVLTDAITRSKIKGAVIIPNDFSTKLSKGQIANMMIITDGSEVNTANYVQNYATQITNNWLSQSKYRSQIHPPAIIPNVRFWYNSDLNSHNFILPGSIAITMTLIGILLTSLVVAREWERGTMEAILSTKVRPIHIVLGKYIPYFCLGMLSLAFNVFLCICIFGIPFRGNYFVLFGVSGLFLFASLGIGLMISTKLKNQFLASLISIGIGFLPALMLSGLLFPINSMPIFFQYLTRILPPRYYVSFVESEFMAGTIWQLVLVNALFLTALGLLLFIGIFKSTLVRLDK